MSFFGSGDEFQDGIKKTPTCWPTPLFLTARWNDSSSLFFSEVETELSSFKSPFTSGLLLPFDFTISSQLIGSIMNNTDNNMIEENIFIKRILKINPEICFRNSITSNNCLKIKRFAVLNVFTIAVQCFSH